LLATSNQKYLSVGSVAFFVCLSAATSYSRGGELRTSRYHLRQGKRTKGLHFAPATRIPAALGDLLGVRGELAAAFEGEARRARDGERPAFEGEYVAACVLRFSRDGEDLLGHGAGELASRGARSIAAETGTVLDVLCFLTFFFRQPALELGFTVDVCDVPVFLLALAALPRLLRPPLASAA
jgi:hypothetical protein